MFVVTNNKITAFYVHAPGIDNPIGMLRDRNLNGSFEDDEIYYFTKDHLGSVREVVGLDGKIKQRQRYSAYGRTTREKNDSELSRLIDQPYGFTSREHDSETGMYYYRARYYDSSVGRFVSEDPIGFDGGDVNLYRYVSNSPLRFTDPLGENKTVIGVALGACAAYVGYKVADRKVRSSVQNNVCTKEPDRKKCNAQAEDNNLFQNLGKLLGLAI